METKGGYIHKEGKGYIVTGMDSHGQQRIPAGTFSGKWAGGKNAGPYWKQPTVRYR